MRLFRLPAAVCLSFRNTRGSPLRRSNAQENMRTLQQAESCANDPSDWRLRSGCIHGDGASSLKLPFLLRRKTLTKIYLEQNSVFFDKLYQFPCSFFKPTVLSRFANCLLDVTQLLNSYFSLINVQADEVVSCKTLLLPQLRKYKPKLARTATYF